MGWGFRAFALGAGRTRASSTSSSSARLDRILSFTGYSIDNVVDDPIAKHAVIGYYKLYRYVQRRSECIDLERQWNP